MVGLNGNISAITIHVDGLNIPAVSGYPTEWVKKNGPDLCFLKETYSKYKMCGLK